jgi:hypothetical protein
MTNEEIAEFVKEQADKKKCLEKKSYSRLPRTIGVNTVLRAISGTVLLAKQKAGKSAL